MKRQHFRLESVLRFYEVRKKRAELDLRDASQKLRRLDAALLQLDNEIVATVAVLQTSAATLTLAGWLACYRKTDQLQKKRGQTQIARDRQAEVVKEFERTRTKWSIKEETLCALKRGTESFNRDQTAKAQQELLDETVLRQWLEKQQAPEVNL